MQVGTGMFPRPYGVVLFLHILFHEAGGVVGLVVDDLRGVGGLSARNAHVEPYALLVDRGSGVLRLELPLRQLLRFVALAVGPEAELLGRVLTDGAAHTLRCGEDATIVVIG